MLRGFDEKQAQALAADCFHVGIDEDKTRRLVGRRARSIGWVNKDRPPEDVAAEAWRRELEQLSRELQSR